MNKVLPLAVLLAFNVAKAQEGFEKLYTQTGSMRLAELSGHSILAGISACQGGSGLVLLDYEGGVLQTSQYRHDPLLDATSFKQYGKNKVYFVSGYATGPCDGGILMDPVVGKMDTTGTIVSFNHYGLNEECQSAAIDMEVTHDKGVITWGWQYDFFALRVDSNLTHQWSRHFARHGHFQFIKELPGGDLLAGINMDTTGSAIARMTANGDLIWCKSYFRPHGYVTDCIAETDSTFMVIGVTDRMDLSNQKLFMMKLNATGEVQWCHGFSTGHLWNSEYPLRVVPTNDSNYALCGTNGSRPLLIKFDPNGDTLWTRYSGVYGHGYETWDFLASADGGFLSCGFITGNLPDNNGQLVYIFKMDSLGVLPCTPVIPLTITTSELFPTDSSFTLISVDGATTIPGSVVDTTFTPNVVYDGCLISQLPPMMPGYRPARAHPNPNTGHFTVSFTDPLMAESYYSVYDTMGRLLYQRPLPKGATTEDVDLSRFGKGTYVIKFTEKGETCFERVVVE